MFGEVESFKNELNKNQLADHYIKQTFPLFDDSIKNTLEESISGKLERYSQNTSFQFALQSSDSLSLKTKILLDSSPFAPFSIFNNLKNNYPTPNLRKLFFIAIGSGISRVPHDQIHLKFFHEEMKNLQDQEELKAALFKGSLGEGYFPKILFEDFIDFEKSAPLFPPTANKKEIIENLFSF